MHLDIVVCGFVVRFVQALLESSLTLVVGLLVAGVLRRMVGAASTRRLFRSGIAGWLRGWLIGMLLPVCSLGVIPVARELRRAGVSGGTVLAFVLAAPLLNPLSFFYALTLTEPSVIICFCVASLLLSTLAGWLWDRVFAPGSSNADDQAVAADELVPVAGPRRLLAIVVTASRDWLSSVFGYYLVGLLGSAILAALIPFGSLQSTMKHSDPTSPYLMLVLAIPIYSSPLPGMMRIGLMFDHGNSIAAAFLLFSLGIGTNLGLLAWLLRVYRPSRFLPWLITWLALVIGLALLAEPFLYDTRKAELDHTHAFDDYANPLPSSGDLGWLLSTVWKRLSERFEAREQMAVGIMGILTLLGLFLRPPQRYAALESWLTWQPPPTQNAPPWWNRPIPGPILGGLALLGLIAISVVGIYVFYPPPEQTLVDLTQVRADALVALYTGKYTEAVRHLELLDVLVRKLQVGVYIRTGSLAPEARRACEEFCALIEEIRDLISRGNVGDQLEPRLKLFEKRYRALRQAFSQ